MPTMFNPEIERTTMQQVVRQWEVYTTTTNTAGTSPTRRFREYTPWALLYTNKTLGRLQDITSLPSSPSHEPIALPTLPPMIGVKKALRPKLAARRHHSSRKPSRDTSPEPLSPSGEEHSKSREEDLKRALVEAALGSLASLGGIYEQREVRWHQEMRRGQGEN
ncbi:hypothetical protein H0H92_010760 [Tricholoma furcatifolium]|nr:hypothetical protein H0H92_010760 [Tricholoma furcatifolium]